MKHGILYFLYIGRLSWLARILLLPGIWWLTRVPPLYEAKFNPGFAFAIIVNLLLLILSMMPAPSDQYARRMIQKYEKEFDTYIHDTYRGKIPFDKIQILKTWQAYRCGPLSLEIKLDGDVITPQLTFVAMMEGQDKVIFESGTYQLFSENSLLRKTWQVRATDHFMVQLRKQSENDGKVDMVFPAWGELAEERFVVVDNFHLREFLTPLDAMIPQDERVHAFIHGDMLSAK